MNERTKESITDFFKYFMNQIKLCCEAFPTCEGCPCSKEHTGCYFRGKTPREWEFPKEFESEEKNEIHN